MNDAKRHGKRWTIPEVLQLHREYDLLNLSVAEMAKNHKRSVDSIIYKLQAEGFILSLDKTSNDSKNKTTAPLREDDVESDADSSSDYDDESVSEYNDSDDRSVVETLSERVWDLETNVQQISSMVKQMFDQMTNQKKDKVTKKRTI